MRVQREAAYYPCHSLDVSGADGVCIVRQLFYPAFDVEFLTGSRQLRSFYPYLFHFGVLSRSLPLPFYSRLFTQLSGWSPNIYLKKMLVLSLQDVVPRTTKQKIESAEITTTNTLKKCQYGIVYLKKYINSQSVMSSNRDINFSIAK
jgi:hypothetical protein